MNESPLAFGIDFGTSNSAVGYKCRDSITLSLLENSSVAMPSALFFDFENDDIQYGKAAVDGYLSDQPGRLLRSLKSILGTSLAKDKTNIKGKLISYQDLIGMFLSELKTRSEINANKECENAVLGRPIRFIDGSDSADIEAQLQLESIARKVGFKNIEFQYEPIAAARDYANSFSTKKIIMVVDIGGGTSDFSILNMSKDLSQSEDFKNSVLANSGVHIGGNNFDSTLSREQIMPFFGYRSKARYPSHSDMPSSFYFKFCSWHEIFSLYSKKAWSELESLRSMAMQPELLDRFLRAVKLRAGHKLLTLSEDAKIELGVSQETYIDLQFIENNLSSNISRERLNSVLENEIRMIEHAALECLQQANIAPAKVESIIFTGGSTKLEIIRELMRRLFPAAAIIDHNVFGAVASGLGIEASMKFK